MLMGSGQWQMLMGSDAPKMLMGSEQWQMLMGSDAVCLAAGRLFMFALILYPMGIVFYCV